MSRQVRVCADCGAKNHPKWRACQRCGADLGAQAAMARSQAAAGEVGADPARKWPWPWLAAGAAGVLVIVAAAGLPRTREALPSPVAKPSASAAPSADHAARPTAAVGAGLAVEVASDLVRQSSAAYDRGDFTGALGLLERAVADNPGDAVAQNNLGQVLVRLGRVPEALPHLTTAASLAPGNWSYRFNLARAQGLGGDWASAVESYQQADRLFPDDHVTLFNLAQALQKSGRQADALPVLERVVAAAPDDPSFLLSLGTAYEQAGRTSDAIITFSKYLDQAPTAPDAGAVKTHVARLQGQAAPEAGPQPGTPQPAPVTDPGPASQSADPGAPPTGQ